jgi:ATP-dependent helicase/nuclease subunit A
MPSLFKIYSSSAGSGKTYQLTKEYLKLALHTNNPVYYKSILAITFTKDAANEMKERIIAALRQFNDPTLSEGEKAKSDHLLATITAEIQQEYPGQEVTEEIIRQRARETFRHLLYHYADFAVSTIDSFVNRIVTSFTRELNIPYNFEVDLDQETLLSSSVELLLDKATRQKEEIQLTQTLENYILEKAEEGRSWNSLPQELTEFGRHLLHEQKIEAIQDFSQLSLEDFRKIRHELTALKKKVEVAVIEEARAALSQIQEAGIEPEELFQTTRGVFGFFTKWEKSFDIYYTNNFAQKTIDEDKWLSGKASGSTKASIQGLKSSLIAHYTSINAICAENADVYSLASAILPHLYKVSVLNELEKCVQVIKRDKNLVHISEFNRQITDIVLKEPVPFIYERLGEKYSHILIDEFQDTSVLQWNNLLPLVDNALATGAFNMVVGDAKQAIYRWRGGEMDQILHLHKRQTERLYPQGPSRELVQERYESISHSLRPAHLNTNYRSAREIIAFNNDLFSFISASATGFPLLQSVYDEGFRQEAPAKGPTGGHLQLLFTHTDDLNRPYDLATGERRPELYEGYTQETLLSYPESTLQLVRQLVEQALADGYQPKDIAILNRFNKNSRLTAAFLKEKGFDIISQDSLALQFADVVNLVIAFFRVFDRPSDTLARSEALYLFCKVVVRVIPDNQLTQTIAEIARGDSSASFFGKIAELGYDLNYQETSNLSLYELTEKLIRVFGLLGKNNECEYLFRFLDVVLAYSLQNSNNLHNFLEHWELHKEELTINTPQDRNAITITSIHRAKGLAYPVVIVPFADWSVKPRTGELLWARVPEELQKHLHLRRAVVTMSSSIGKGPFQEQYQLEQEKTFIDNLNMLYVAFTRPMDRLYIIGDKKKAGSEGNISSWLCRFLQHKDLWREDQQVYLLCQGGPGRTRSGAPTGPLFQLEKFTSADWTQRLRLKQHANNIFDFETQQQHRKLYRKLHHALSRLPTADALDPVLRQLINEGIISQRERPELEQQLRQVIGHPELARYFSKDVVYELEKEILDPRAIRYKPDRIMFDPAKNKVMLLDFRTPPEKQEYLDNLNLYADLFRELAYGSVACVIYYFEEERVQQWEVSGELLK